MLRTSTTPAPEIGGVVVHISGVAGMAEVGQLGTLLREVAAGAPHSAVIDMSGLDMLTSVCISELVIFRRTVTAAAREDGRPGRVVIAGAHGMVEQSLRIARLNELFELFADVVGARAALSR